MELLPFLDGWRYQYERLFGTLKIGENKTVFDTGQENITKGYFLDAGAYLTGSLDGKYTEFYIIIDGPSRPFPLKGYMVDARLLMDAKPINFGPFMTRFSNAQKTYAAMWSQAYPLGFRTRIQAYFKPPAAPMEELKPIPINYEAFLSLVIIDDKEAFIKSYAAVMELMGMAPSITEVGKEEKKIGTEEKITETKVVFNPPPFP